MLKTKPKPTRITVCVRETNGIPVILAQGLRGTFALARQGACYAMAYEGCCARTVSSMSLGTCDRHGRRVLLLPQGAVPRDADAARAS